jgi:hypothetical protein
MLNGTLYIVSIRTWTKMVHDCKCAILYKRDDCLPCIMVGLGETGTTAKLENVLSKKDDAVKL